MIDAAEGFVAQIIILLMAGVKFTRESAQRIANAVRKSEGAQVQPLRRTGPRAIDGGYRILVCKTTEAATAGATWTCEIWDAGDQGAFLGTGDEIEVYFRLGDAATNKWVYVVETVRGYEALNPEC